LVVVETDVRAVSLAIWATLFVAVVALEVAGRRRLGALAPLGQVLRALRDAPVGRGVLVLLWMWLGWHVFAR
jgi:hypothetical protein